MVREVPDRLFVFIERRWIHYSKPVVFGFLLFKVTVDKRMGDWFIILRLNCWFLRNRYRSYQRLPIPFTAVIYLRLRQRLRVTLHVFQSKFLGHIRNQFSVWAENISCLCKFLRRFDILRLLQNPFRTIIFDQQIDDCLVFNHRASLSVHFKRPLYILLNLMSQSNSVQMQNIKEGGWSYPSGFVLIDILKKRF